MMRKLLALSVVAVMSFTLMPASADPLSQRDMTKVLQQAPKRYLASEPGKREQLSLVFGPYVIPPGQDSNRLTMDVQLPAGFVTSVSPDLVDAASGRVPTEQVAHIHHAHWFRVTDDPNEVYYTDVVGGQVRDPSGLVPPEVLDTLPAKAGLSWVFGTGEEKTQGGFELRERLDDTNNDGRPDQRYGMEIDGGERQLLIYMIHNKTSGPLEVFVVLDVDFTHGTSEQIKDATGIPMHALKGQLFGQTRDALRNYPALIGESGGVGWEAELDGTAIVAGGHAHPGVYGNFITNQGPGGKCKADLDNDGFPGITILRSRKIDHVAATWPYSEDFQMGVAKYGWRAPVHGPADLDLDGDIDRAGDYITQYAVYDIDNETKDPLLPGFNGKDAATFALPGNYAALGGPSAADLAGKDSVDGLTHQHFEAMNHMGIYVDPQLAPTAYGIADSNGCPTNFAAASGVSLLGTDNQATQQKLRADGAGIEPYFAVGATEGMQNHVWPELDPTCGLSPHSGRDECNTPNEYATDHSGLPTESIHISGFQFLPGTYGNPGALGAPARVTKGSVLSIVNEDAAINVRHTFTTCDWPCTGAYVANYPQPDGLIDTGKLGNVDPIDGGGSVNYQGAQARFEDGDYEGAFDTFIDSETVPLYRLDTSSLDTGFYSYFCRIHPFMRGAFELI